MQIGNAPAAWTVTLQIAAGVMGAAGVALAAVAAHAVQSPGLASAAQMMIVHAAAIVAIVALAATSRFPRLMLAVATAMLAGALLFGTDVALLNLAGRRLFPYAAPTGGSTMIASWLALAVAGVVDLARSRDR